MSDIEEINLPISSSWQRFINLLIDYFMVMIFGGVLGFILGANGASEVIINTNEYILGAIITLLYYVPQEALFGRTIGKLITGTKVVQQNGNKVLISQVIGRTFCRFIPFEAFSFFGGQGKPVGWHDSIPKTVVIKTRNV